MSSVNWDEKYLLYKIVEFLNAVCEEFGLGLVTYIIVFVKCGSQTSEEKGNGLMISLFHQIS